MSFNAALAAQLAAVESTKPKSGGGGKKFPPKGKRAFNPGPEVKFAKAGVFTWDELNAKGNPYVETSPKLKVIILDAKFRFRDAGKERTGQFEQHCVTTGHTELQDDGKGGYAPGPGNGWWPVPAYDHGVIFQNFKPVGSKFVPEGLELNGEVVDHLDENGEPKLLTCEQCHALGLNRLDPSKPYDSKANPVMCKDEGYVVAYVIGSVDPKSEEWVDLEATGKAKLMTFKWGRGSNDPYARYMSKLAVEYQAGVETVITEMSTGNPDKNGNYKAVMATEHLDPELLARAQEVYAAAKQEWLDEQKAWADEQKGKREADKAAGGGTVTNIADKRDAKPVGAAAAKAAAKPGAATTQAKVSTPAADLDDEDSIPF